VRTLLAALRDRWRHRHDPYPCQHAVELVTDYLEGALDTDETTRFEQHLNACPPCVRYVAQVRATASTLGHVEPPAPDASTRTALIDAFRDFRREAN
jgi:anti-sigma factor RsiW